MKIYTFDERENFRIIFSFQRKYFSDFGLSSKGDYYFYGIDLAKKDENVFITITSETLEKEK